MHWKFEKMFSIRIVHQHLPDEPSDAATDRPAFSVAPTLATAQRFKQLAWMVKPVWNGLMIFAERTVRTDKSLTAPKRPQSEEALSFVIGLNDVSLLKKTKPYMKMNGSNPEPNDSLPAFSGRARLLYLNNLSTVPESDGRLRLTAGAFVDVPEFASRAPTIFEFPAAQPGISSVEATAILPNPPPAVVFPFKSFVSKVQVDLAHNAYKMVQKPGSTSLAETLFLTDEILPNNALGIVSIFDIASAPIDQNKTFQLAFAKI